MFGHDYTDEEIEALHEIEERNMFGSISPAGIHNDYPALAQDVFVEENIDYKEKYLKLAKLYKQLLRKTSKRKRR